MTKAEREALEEIATGLGLAYYAVSHNRTDEALLHIGHHEAKLRAILATIDKPATRYPWADAPEWAMWAAMDCGGHYAWFETKPVIGDSDVLWVNGKRGGKVKEAGIRPGKKNWRNSLERRPDAP